MNVLAALERVDADDSVKIVVLTGQGKALLRNFLGLTRAARMA